MVQNWENFMDPGAGAYDTNFATGGASILASLGIDFLARRTVDNFTKINPADKVGLARRFYGVGTSRKGGIKSVTEDVLINEEGLLGKYNLGQTVGGKLGRDGKFKTKVYPVGKQGRVAMREDLNKYIKQTEGRLKKRYAGTSNLLKGLSWTLATTGVMMMVEGMTMPGTVSRQAMMSDNRAMMGQGPMDSQQAYTQRQRALMAIHDSQLGIRNVIGNEAGHLHR